MNISLLRFSVKLININNAIVKIINMFLFNNNQDLFKIINYPHRSVDRLFIWLLAK